MREILKALRKDMKLTVEDVAVRLGISAWHYYKIEQGSRNPSIHLAKQIADILGTNVDALFFAQKLDVASSDEEASTHG